MKNGDRCKKIFWAFLAVLWPAAAGVGQSHQDSSQTQSQPEQKKSEAGGDATKNPEKEKAKPKKVYTEEDLSGMRGNGVSIVGDDKPAGGGAAGAKKAAGKRKTGGKRGPSRRGSAEGAQSLNQGGGNAARRYATERDAGRHLALETFVQEIRPRPKLTVGPVVLERRSQ